MARADHREAALNLNWDDREVAVARMALTQLSYSTDTGAEKTVIAGMLADLAQPGEVAELREAFERAIGVSADGGAANPVAH